MLSYVWNKVTAFLHQPTHHHKRNNLGDDDESEMGKPTSKKSRQRYEQGSSNQVHERPRTNHANWILPAMRPFGETYKVLPRADANDVVEIVDVDESEATSCGGTLARLPIRENVMQSCITKVNEMTLLNEPLMFIDLTGETASSSGKEDHVQNIRDDLSSDIHIRDVSSDMLKHARHMSRGSNRKLMAEKYTKQPFGWRGQTGKECIRLKEKEIYRKLMQDCTLAPLRSAGTLGSPRISTLFYKKNADDSMPAANLPVRTEKLPTSLGEEMKLRCARRRSAPLVDLTTSVWENSSTGTMKKPQLSPKAKEDIVKTRQSDVDISHSVKSSENEDDIVIIDDISQISAKPARGNRTRKIEERNKDRQYIDLTWLANFQDKHESDRLSCEHAIKEQSLKTSELVKQKEESVKICAKLKEKRAIKDILTGIYEIDIIDITPEEDVEDLAELTQEMSSAITAALRPSPPNEVLVEGFSIPVSRRDMHTLAGTIWLNDAVINFYMNLLIERGKLENFPTVHAFSTFFYPKLKKDGYNSLRRWTKKVDVFAHDFLVVPVHLGVHWCLAVADFKKNEINYYDSMGGNNDECLMAIQEYLKAESLDKKKTVFGMTDWKLQNIKNIPQQQNGCDCGVFACQYAASVTRNSKITFTQNDMPYFRRRMVYEILKKRLL